MEYVHYRFPRQRYILRLLLRPDSLGNRYLSKRRRGVGQQLIEGVSGIGEIRTKIHDMVTTDSTVIDDDIPCPERYCVPLIHSISGAITDVVTHRARLGAYLFYFEPLLPFFAILLSFGWGRGGGGINFHVGHCGECTRASCGLLRARVWSHRPFWEHVATSHSTGSNTHLADLSLSLS